MTTRKKDVLPGTITTAERADKTGWGWQWVSDKGNVHFNNGPFDNKTAARRAADKWVRANVIGGDDTVEDE